MDETDSPSTAPPPSAWSLLERLTNELVDVVTDRVIAHLPSRISPTPKAVLEALENDDVMACIQVIIHDYAHSKEFQNQVKDLIERMDFVDEDRCSEIAARVVDNATVDVTISS